MPRNYGRSPSPSAGGGSTTITNNYTIVSGITMVNADATAGEIEITLPAAAANTNSTYSIRKTDSTTNRVKVKDSGGTVKYSLINQYQVCSVASDGTNWNLLSAIPTEFNVIHFGAIGNGAALDSTAIQAAIDAAHAVGGGRVYCPGGTYLLTTSLEMYDYVTLEGDPEVTHFTCTGSIGCMIKSKTPSTRTNYWYIKDLMLWAWPGDDGIVMHNVSRSKVENVFISRVQTEVGNIGKGISITADAYPGGAYYNIIERPIISYGNYGIYLSGSNVTQVDIITPRIAACTTSVYGNISGLNISGGALETGTNAIDLDGTGAGANIDKVWVENFTNGLKIAGGYNWTTINGNRWGACTQIINSSNPLGVYGSDPTRAVDRHNVQQLWLFEDYNIGRSIIKTDSARVSFRNITNNAYFPVQMKELRIWLAEQSGTPAVDYYADLAVNNVDGSGCLSIIPSGRKTGINAVPTSANLGEFTVTDNAGDSIIGVNGSVDVDGNIVGACDFFNYSFPMGGIRMYREGPTYGYESKMGLFVRAGIDPAYPAMWIRKTGLIGIGNDNPGARLDVLHASSPQLRLSQAASSKYVNFQADSNGDLTITPSGDAIFIPFGKVLTLANVGLHVLDTDHSHDLIIKPGSDLTSDRTLTVTTGDSNRTLTLNDNATLSDWFNQSVKTSATPEFAGLKASGSIYNSSEYDNGNSGVSDTIDWGIGNCQKSTLTGNCTFTFTPMSGVGILTLKLVQDGTGGRTVTWPATVLQPGDVNPVLSSAANAVDIIQFYYDGTNYHIINFIADLK